jgi:hypothetical protein
LEIDFLDIMIRLEKEFDVSKLPNLLLTSEQRRQAKFALRRRRLDRRRGRIAAHAAQIRPGAHGGRMHFLRGFNILLSVNALPAEFTRFGPVILISFALIAAAVGMILLPLTIIRFIRDSNRASRNECVTCGYDLRASEDKCPECGAPIPHD